MAINWNYWCRLCSKENGSEVDILSDFKIKDDTICNLQQTIEKHFSVLINENLAPTGICQSCYKFVRDLEMFADRVTKVNLMFSELLEEKVCISEDNVDCIRQLFSINSDCVLDKCDQSTDTNDLMIEYLQVGDDSEHTLNTVVETAVKAEPTEVYENFVIIEDNEKDGENDPVCVVIKTENKEEGVIVQLENVQDEIDEEKIEKSWNIEDNNDGNLGKRKLRSKEISYKLADDDEKHYHYNDTEEYDSGEDDDNKHKRKGRKRKSSRPKKRREIINEVEKRFQCEICEKSFARKITLRYHKENVHEVTQELKFECLLCNKKFSTERRLRQHVPVHLPPEQKMLHPCPYCDKKFTKSVNVNPHIRAVHIGEKSFICEECGKTFVTKGALKEHMYTHIEETPFECSKCPKKFKNAARLKVHEDTHNDTVYVCPYCGLQLNTRRTLNMHMVIHSDAKKYKCEYCGSEFKRSKTLKNHLILHTGLRPYTCQFCDKTFANGSNCRSHKKKAHPVELAALEMTGEAITPATNIPRLEQLKAVAAQASPLNNQQKLSHKKLQQQQQKHHLPQQLDKQQSELQQEQQQKQSPQLEEQQELQLRIQNHQQEQIQHDQQDQRMDQKQQDNISVNHEQDSNLSSISYSHSQQSSIQISQNDSQQSTSNSFPFLTDAQRDGFQGYHNLPKEINEQMQLHRQTVYEHLKLALSQ